MAYGLTTYADATRRQDLLDIIRNISPAETGLTEMLSRDTSQGLKAIAETERKEWAVKSAKTMKKWLTLMK